MSSPGQDGSDTALDGGAPSTMSETKTTKTRPSDATPSNGASESTPAARETNAELTTAADPQGTALEQNRVISGKEADAPDAAQEDGTKKPAWNSSATLYCPLNGHLHSSLVDFGIYQCVVCDQSLSRSGPPPVSSSLNNDGDDSGGETEEHGDQPEPDKVDDEPDAIPEHLKVGHTIEYQDLGGYYITSEERDRPFHLERERNMALSKGLTRNRETVFKVTTVLRTTVPADPSRISYETKEILERGLIGNPQVSVAVQYTKITILSRLFVDALKSVVSYDTQDKLESGKLDLNEPFSVIGHHLEALEDYVGRVDGPSSAGLTSGGSPREVVAAPTDESNAVDRETRIHVRLVLTFVNSILKDPIAEERARHQRDVPTCTYRMMWYLLRPGDAVYVMSEEAEDAYVVDSVEMDKFSLSSMDVNRECHVQLWYLDFDGECITRARKEVTVRPFKGERPIASLSVVPCEIWDRTDGGKLRQTLEERGKKWVDHLLGKLVEYKGEPFKPGRNTVEGRSYVDPASYYGLDGNTPDFEPLSSGISGSPGDLSGVCNCSICTRARARAEKSTMVHTPGASYDNLSIKKIGSFVDDLGRRNGYLLCSRRLKGFVFSTRAWHTLDIRYCLPVKPDKNPFARLVMPNERKMMIKALVYKYTDPKYAGHHSQVWGADFIKNKGEGQVFLLHGGPGVGKTFTAECISEFTGRPLLALTCGDIGTEEVQMEKKLRGWLRLAHKWGAVMLIDEADVFLEKRVDSDLRRNSLVSVFLREIEYYQGILFLTSNRVGKFDDAIISRIHVVIHYKGLDDEYREKIWNQFFDKLQSERGSTMKIENSAKRYVLENKKMVEMKWNGREIRNAFQTAVALAEYRFLIKPPTEKEDGEIAVLEEEDFKQICEMTIKFKEYLIDMNEGQDEEMRARQDKARLS